MTTFWLIYSAGVCLSLAINWHIANKYRDFIEYELGQRYDTWVLKSIVISMLFWELVLVGFVVGVLMDVTGGKQS